MSQQDPAWAGVPLGQSSTNSIGSSGCVITSVAMLLGSYGVKADPAQINAWLSANGGYVDGDNLLWDQVSALSGGQVTFTGWYGADLDTLNSELSKSQPVIAEVSLNGNQHFVLITGFSGSDYSINDPWFGDHVTFGDRYGNPATGILSIRTFAPVGTAADGREMRGRQ